MIFRFTNIPKKSHQSYIKLIFCFIVLQSKIVILKYKCIYDLRSCPSREYQCSSSIGIYAGFFRFSQNNKGGKEINMKKRKILYLFPLAALVLSGCTFQEGWDATKTWVSDHIWTPILNLFGGKKSDDSGKKQDGGNTPAPSTDSDTEEIVATEVGSVDNPLTVSAFQTLCDQNITYEGIEEGKSVTDFAHIAYVKAKVSSNTWNTEGTKIQYLNLVDQTNASLQITGMFVIVDASVTGDYSAKDSLKGLEVVVKGYPALYNKKGTKTYELVSKDKSDSENPRLMKVVAPTPTPGLNYGTLENPLTVSQAKALIDTENPTAVKAYVTGEVKSNEAYSATYKNVMRITITDGTADLVIFKCGTFPEGFDGTAITANSLKGKTVVANGLGELFQGTTYELTAPQIFSIEGEDVPPVVIDNYGTLESPLSISEAMDVIDAEGTSKQTVYVTGEVKSNIAWDESHSNIDIVLTDGEHDFKLFRASKLPNDIKPAANDLVGKIIVAHGSATIYGSTYELAQNCEVDSITDAAPVEVELVQLSSESIEMEVGGHVTLEAFVSPNEADQSVEWSISQEGEVVSFENNVVTGLAVGTATITATSVADPTKSASCTVTVSEATKLLTGITVDTTNAKTEYEEGDNYSAEGLVVTAHYSNAADEDVTAFVQWEFDPVTATLGDESVSITANYNAESSVNVIAVTVSEHVAEKGSEGNPYTAAEARAAVDAGTGVTGVYATGIVNRIAYAFSGGSMSFYFSDDGSATNEVEAYKLAATADPGIEVGDKVTVTGNLVKYNSTYEFSEGCTLANLAKGSVQSVVVSGTATKTEYVAGETYNHNGLVATANFDNGGAVDVSTLATWSINPTTASATDTSISVTAEYKNVPSAAFVVNVTVSSDAPTYVDATMAKGSTNSYDDVTINSQSSIKMGSSKAAGNMTITVGAGATKLKFYCVAWKGEGGASCPVTFSGATVTPNSFNPVANDVISGSTKAFTLENVETYLIEVTLSGITSETSITLTTTKRAIVWGAQYAV